MLRPLFNSDHDNNDKGNNNDVNNSNNFIVIAVKVIVKEVM